MTRDEFDAGLDPRDLKESNERLAARERERTDEIRRAIEEAIGKMPAGWPYMASEGPRRKGVPRPDGDVARETDRRRAAADRDNRKAGAMSDDEIRDWLRRAGYYGERLEAMVRDVRRAASQVAPFELTAEQAEQWERDLLITGTVKPMTPGEQALRRQAEAQAAFKQHQAAVEFRRQMESVSAAISEDQVERFEKARAASERDLAEADMRNPVRRTLAEVLGAAGSRPVRWSWPPWASCAVGWAVAVGVEAAIIGLCWTDYPGWHAVAAGALLGFQGVIAGDVLDSIFREPAIRASGQESRPTVEAAPRRATARAFSLLGAGDCAVCERPVRSAMPWWTKDPEKYEDARPIHDGDCWARWSD